MSARGYQGRTELTVGQAEALMLIEAYDDAHGRPPTHGECRKLLGKDPTQVLEVLDDKRRIELRPGQRMRLVTKQARQGAA